jgi:hypothetical protein
VPNGVYVVWADLLEESIEVACRLSCLTLVAMCGSRDVPHARAIRLPVVAVIVVDHVRSPIRMLLVPSLATLGALQGAVDGDIRGCLLVIA